jgi:hypothetical protein
MFSLEIVALVVWAECVGEMCDVSVIPRLLIVFSRPQLVDCWNLLEGLACVHRESFLLGHEL